MPREQLFITPIIELSLPAINEFITQLNQRMTAIQEALTKSEGLDGHTPQLFNDLDLQAHTIRNIKSISFSDPLTIGPLQTFVITKPGDAPADSTALRDDIATRVLPTISAALEALRTQTNTLLTRLK